MVCRCLVHGAAVTEQHTAPAAAEAGAAQLLAVAAGWAHQSVGQAATHAVHMVLMVRVVLRMFGFKCVLVCVVYVLHQPSSCKGCAALRQLCYYQGCRHTCCCSL